jgi:hypothetical protein
MAKRENNSPALLIAARGWQHEHWDNQYYPDDLPGDWQLAFYGNEFHAVVVPAASWMAASPQDVQQWLDDVDDEFRFYLELPETLVVASDVEKAGILKDHFAGFLLMAGSPPDNIPGNIPVYRILTAAEAGRSETDGARWGIVLGGDESAEALQGEGLEVLILEEGSDSPMDLKWLRQIVETALRHASGRTHLLLVFAGTEPRIDDMQNAQIIADLLDV